MLLDYVYAAAGNAVMDLCATSCQSVISTSYFVGLDQLRPLIDLIKSLQRGWCIRWMLSYTLALHRSAMCKYALYETLVLLDQSLAGVHLDVCSLYAFGHCTCRLHHAAVHRPGGAHTGSRLRRAHTRLRCVNASWDGPGRDFTTVLCRVQEFSELGNMVSGSLCNFFDHRP